MRQEAMETIITTTYRSPLGEMILGSYGDRLCVCDWTEGRHRAVTHRRIACLLDAGYADGLSDVIRLTHTQLDEYFAGCRRVFSVPVMFIGTPFQCRVWTELTKIPYGTTISYGELARRIGNPKAVRAVASANGANPTTVIVPCHRVIGSDNSLTGYSGGIAVKKALLALESENPKT